VDSDLPSNRDFYYYEGSLTTPPCSEVVQWFVLKQPIQIPASYISTLRKVEEDEHGTLLTHNVRDEQPLNGRIVMQTPIGKTTVSDKNQYTASNRGAPSSTPFNSLLSLTFQCQKHALRLASLDVAEGMAVAAMSLLADVGVTHPAITTTTAAQIFPPWDVHVR